MKQFKIRHVKVPLRRSWRERLRHTWINLRRIPIFLWRTWAGPWEDMEITGEEHPDFDNAEGTTFQEYQAPARGHLSPKGDGTYEFVRVEPNYVEFPE